jgi:LDH2 family malate/lactate/ureidoglycolate dehydrogenase
MNQPPSDAVRVPAERLQRFVQDAATKAGIPAGQAATLAELLIASDLRGVRSHGSRQIVRYVREIRSGGLNPTPTISIARETSNSVIVDGDFGLGYFPALEATRRAVEKANAHGMAVMVTRHHGHIGAAGIYARMTLEHDLLTFVTSGVQLDLKPGSSIVHAAGGSPMSFSAPTLNEPPMVLDCGVTHDVQGNAPHRDEIFQLAPGMIHRALGLGNVCQVWGGLLTGLPIDRARGSQKFLAANQGAMAFMFKISLFTDVDAFKREMDEYVQRVRTLRAMDGHGKSYLPGGIEAEHEADYRRQGIPLGREHRQHLESLAAELGLPVPW